MRAASATVRTNIGVLPRSDAHLPQHRSPFAAIHLLESAPQEDFTGAHEDLPHMP